MKAIWNGATLAQSDRTIVVEGNHYFPPEAVNRELFQRSETHTICPWKGEASYYSVAVDGRTNRDAAWFYPSPKPAAAEIKVPLAPSYREEPYWWRDAAPIRLPQAALPTEADVVIIGGGYTGMMAAARLAWRGRSVTVLEQNELGWGASSRNGGMVLPGFKSDPGSLLRRYGDHGRQLYQATLDAMALVEETIRANQIDCQYAQTGQLYLAHKPALVRHLDDEAHILSQQFGLAARVIPRVELASEIGSSRYYGGLLVERSGGLHPAKYFAGLARLARDRGAHLYDHTPATAIERRHRGGFAVSTPRGRISAGNVLLATNGYSDSIVPSVRRRVIPIGSYIIATEPLTSELAQSAIPNRRMLIDSKNFLYYWRLSADNRMLFGGRASFAPTTIPKARDWLYAAMTRVHPQLRGVRVEHAWSGLVGFTFDRMPHIGRINGVTYALGYCGTGVAMSTYFGQLAADWIAGDALPPFWQRPFPSMPLYREKAWFLPALGWYYRTLDGLGGGGLP
ncbi:MAG: FAD-dependent oxidoreductase [Chloroflexi bacterium]|nr:MAG: FAD-dependent oxidoreductase [Chloroflexota bacterium]